MAQDEQTSDDVGAAAGAAVRPRFHFAQLHRQPPTWVDELKRQAQRSRLWLAADALLIAYGVLQGGPAWVAAGVLAGLAPFVMSALGHPQADRYQRLLRHHARGNWQAVRVLAAELRGAAARRPELGFDLDVRLAGITAREDGMAAALAALEPWRARLAGRPGFFDGRLAAVHLMAGDTAGHVAAMARAHAADAAQPVRQVDLALAEARFGDVERADALLSAVDAARLPSPGPGYLAWARGLVALKRGSAVQAAELLEEAVDGLSSLADQPAGWVTLAACVCDHAIALHQSGRHEAARALVAEVWPVLEAHGTVPLLRMLEADALLPPQARPNT